MQTLKIRAWDKFNNQYASLKEWMPIFDIELGVATLYQGELSHYEFELYIGRNDINGVEVYQGDRVLITYGKCYTNPNGLTRKGTVIWDEKACAFKVAINDSVLNVSFDIISFIEIIGLRRSDI